MKFLVPIYDERGQPLAVPIESLAPGLRPIGVQTLVNADKIAHGGLSSPWQDREPVKDGDTLT